MIEPLVYRPSLARPFGKSRISRAVMSINDSAVRTALRSEVASEFFTAPQKYLLGADDNTFTETTKWEAYIGNIFAITANENGDIPHFGQLSQASMQPHTDYFRSLAARFAGETNIPISELGVIHDNPSSAQAIEAAKEPLIIEAENLNETNGEALRVIAMMALAIKGNKPLSELTEEERSVRPVFKNPAMPSLVTVADAMCKAISPAGAQWVATTETYWRSLGFDEPTIDTLMAEYKKIRAQETILAAQQQEQEGHKATMYEMASIIKSYRAGKISLENALVLFGQIGIEEQQARSILGDSKDIQETITDGYGTTEGEGRQAPQGQVAAY